MKLVVVTGAYGLLGQAVVKLLLSKGYLIVATTSSRQKHLSDFKHARIYSLFVDLLEDTAPSQILEECRRLGSSTYGFVHLARSRGNLQGRNSDKLSWLREFELAAFAPYAIGVRLAREHELQRIVVGSSIYGIRAQKPDLYRAPDGLNPHYSAARAACTQVARDLAVQLAPNCQVNSVAWGGIEGQADDFTKRAYSEQNPSGRMLKPREAAEAVLFLLSTENAGLTGHNLVVDGGWTAW